MRESIGGSMLFYIVLFFLSIFIFFIASVIRYARVYKIKNSMVNYVERNEGFLSKSEFDDELSKLGYQENGRYKVCRYFPSEIGGYYYIELSKWLCQGEALKARQISNKETASFSIYDYLLSLGNLSWTNNAITALAV